MKDLKPLVSQILLYISFHVLIWGLHLIVLSVVAFFHFSLEHSMTILDDWIFSKAWSLSLISKIIATFIIIKLVTIKSNFRSPVFEILKKSNKSISPKNIVLIIFILLSFFFLGRTNSNYEQQVRLLEWISSYFGSCVFYGLDIIVILFLDYFYKINIGQKILQIVFFPFVFLFFTKTTFYIDVGTVPMVYFYSFLLLVSYNYFKHNIMNAFLFIAVVIAPFNAFMGLDIMWGGKYSLVNLSQSQSLPTIITFLILSVFHWYWCIKKEMKTVSV